MKQAELAKYRALAEHHKKDRGAARIILKLLDEIDLLKKKAGAGNNKGPLRDDSPFPFGKHKGTELHEVPQDYLHWWFNQNSDRGMIELEVQCHPFPKKMIAIKKLRLHDYLAAKFKT